VRYGVTKWSGGAVRWCSEEVRCRCAVLWCSPLRLCGCGVTVLSVAAVRRDDALRYDCVTRRCSSLCCSARRCSVQWWLVSLLSPIYLTIQHQFFSLVMI